MTEIPFIDLHPEKIRGNDPAVALLACRQFLENALRRGTRGVRIITGLGIHGDGTPRLRSRVERDVLPAFATSILSQHYEQGGAVIRLELEPIPVAPGKTYQKKFKRERDHQSLIQREERLLVAIERLEAAGACFDEGDLRKCRLKLNQIVKEFFPQQQPYGSSKDELEEGLLVLGKFIDGLEQK